MRLRIELFVEDVSVSAALLAAGRGAGVEIVIEVENLTAAVQLGQGAGHPLVERVTATRP